MNIDRPAIPLYLPSESTFECVQFTGADLSAVASNALQLALRRRVAEIEEQVCNQPRRAIVNPFEAESVFAPSEVTTGATTAIYSI